MLRMPFLDMLGGAQYRDAMICMSGAQYKGDDDLSGAQYRDDDLSGAQYRDIDLSGAQYRDDDLSGAQYRDDDLRR
eukprot:Em0020g128a